MKKIYFLSVILVSGLFLGCTPIYQAKEIHLLPTIDKVDFNNTNKLYRHEPWAKKKRPFLGIALAGGGSKASPFAMGVLKRFVDKGWMKDVDIISSVSGGGYSAYYLFSKAIYQSKQNEDYNLTKFFENCELDKLKNKKTFKDYNDSLHTKECTEYGKYQTQIKKHQDLLSFFISESARGASWKDDVKAAGTFVGGFGASVATTPVHHATNTLFDWKIELSPTQFLYKKGIIRAYGEVENKVHKDETFTELRKITKNSELPLWVINSTNFEKFWWQHPFRKDDADLSQSIFEITPFGFGSGRYGHSLDYPDNLGLDLPRATLASSAFADALKDMNGQGAILGALHLINLRWGIKIPNYNVSEIHQRWHNTLPLPLYYFDKKASKITLTDGGHSGDNLGLYALIKRGTENIVIVSGSNDSDGDKLKLEDMCEVSKYLEKKNMSVWFEGNATDYNDTKNLDFCKNFCMDEAQRISFYKWQKPVWEGYVKDENNQTISNLFFIKSAIDKKDLNISARKIANEIANKEKNSTQYIDFIDGDGYKDKEKQTYPYHYPYSLAFFWQNNGYDKSSSSFPQTSTVWTTLNSSQNLYQAYMDLGFYLSGYLEKVKFRHVNEMK